MTKTSGKCHWK